MTQATNIDEGVYNVAASGNKSSKDAGARVRKFVGAISVESVFAWARCCTFSKKGHWVLRTNGKTAISFAEHAAPVVEAYLA